MSWGVLYKSVDFVGYSVYKSLDDDKVVLTNHALFYHIFG